MPLLRRCFCLLAGLLLPLSALAWGPVGHRIVGDLAERQLTPAAEIEVKRLLAGEPVPSLAGVANWADQLRQLDPDRFKRTSRFHYLNFPHDDCSYVPARDCPDGQCAVAAINRNFLVLSDRSRGDGERGDALKFLVHFVGDLHQPMHTGYVDDRGGNAYQISYQGTAWHAKPKPEGYDGYQPNGWNLHSVWDSLIVESRGLDAPHYAAALARQPALPPDPARMSDRPAVEWALESCHIAHGADIYPSGHTMGDDYLIAHRPVVETRLRRAGARLAMMINYALSPRSGH